MQTFPRLTRLFGCRVDELDETAIRKAIAARVRENDELDFKREHHDDPDELAKDVAALANNIGGVLVLGVADDRGQASYANPVEISDRINRHINAVIGSRVQPFISGIRIHTISSERRGFGFLLVIVPQSSEAPHAIINPEAPVTLRYPVRDGSATRWLGEHELSRRYADRFQARAGAAARLDQVHSEGLSRIAHWRSPWLAVSVVPIVLGQRGVGSERIAAERNFVRSVWTPVPTSPFQAVPVRAGRARGILTDQIEYTGHYADPHAELHYDGAGFASSNRDHKRADDPEVDEMLVGPGRDARADAILQDALEIQLLALLWMLGQHANDTGATGELLVRAHQLLLEQTGPAHPVTPAQMWKTGPSPMRGEDWGIYIVAEDSFSLRDQTRPVDTAVELDELVSDERRAVSVAHDLAADILGDFGVSEPMILRPDGGLSVHCLHPSHRDEITLWAQQRGLIAKRTTTPSP
ncbi:hypothetical protein NJB1507_08350 [Mycobacterium marinum]|uniref:AlbA family DNA-binding domain-containing protein n=1 Tax=Mycobacterium marinum TaxID=1781 RepID=UPI0021C276B9|nr:ATP-binding protein [Mycobacterium marinum]GJO17862.1 hypothetical protein NJB1507_08350 [Mycobacterium marinum]